MFKKKHSRVDTSRLYRYKLRLFLLGIHAALTAPIVCAQNNPVCESFANKTMAHGSGTDLVCGVYAVGTTVYVATNGGLSISTDGGKSFVNKTTAHGLGNNYISDVYAVGTTVYAATQSGLSISTDSGKKFITKTTLKETLVCDCKFLIIRNLVANRNDDS